MLGGGVDLFDELTACGNCPNGVRSALSPVVARLDRVVEAVMEWKGDISLWVAKFMGLECDCAECWVMLVIFKVIKLSVSPKMCPKFSCKILNYSMSGKSTPENSITYQLTAIR